MTLFRNEVVEFQRQQRHGGEVVLLQPVSTKLLSWIGILAFVIIVAFLFIAQYSRKQTVDGYLVPIAGTSKVFAPNGGVIKEVFVRQGDVTHKGDPLFTVSTEQIAADRSNVLGEVLAVLRQQKTLLMQQITAEETRVISERERLAHMLASYADEQTSLQTQWTNQEQRIRLAETLVTSATDLRQKGLLSNLEYTGRLSNVLEQRQKLDGIEQQRLRLRNQIIETRATLDQLPIVMGEKVQMLRNELAQVEQRMSEVNGRRAYTVQSPADGKIALMTVSPGQTADPKHLLMTIVPADSALEADLLVPTRAIGFIMPGEKVRILYDAFPYQEFGAHTGTVVAVSQSMLTEDNGPVPLHQPSYKVRVALDRYDIDTQSRTIPLQPDMTLKADVILEKRPLIRWLLAPLMGTRF
jgi:membrane fusion protein